MTPTIATQLDECIAANEAANVDSTSRYMLDRLSDRLRKYRVTLSKLHPEEVALWTGDNWQGPAIAAAIRESAQFRQLGKAVSIEPLPRVTTKVRKLDPAIWGEVA